MIGAHIEQLALAIDALARDAEDPQHLAAQVRATYPHESVGILRQAMFYAITDPDRSDGGTMLRLQGAAIALKNGHHLHAGVRIVQAPESCGGTCDA